MDDLIQAFEELNDPMNDIVELFKSSVHIKENIDILCEAIDKEGEILDDIDGRLTDEFLLESDSRLQNYMRYIYDQLMDHPNIGKRLDKYLNISDRRRKFKLLVMIDQYLLREIIKVCKTDELNEYLFEIVHRDGTVTL